ncbi:MAG: Mfa1 family fimbria major subunit [Tannerellaceae bacterium]|nr:Mfa1 family fimbria major subunit [Tannerellaceae bacterium]
MKKMFKFFVISVAIATGMVACSSEEILPENKASIERANLTIVVNSNAAATKAIDDNNAVDSEKAISSVSLFVFGAATQAEADTIFATTGAGGITDDGQNKVKVVFNNAPVGSKKVYVGINLPADLHNLIKNNGVGAERVLSSLTDLAKLSPANGGFPMFSDESKSSILNIEQGKTNELEVRVKRFVAKVTLETTEDFENNTNNERTVDGVTINGNLFFAMGQMNTKFYPFPRNIGGVYQDPNHFAVISNGQLVYAADFINEFYDFKANASNWNSSTTGVDAGFKQVATKSQSATITNFKPGYVLENTNDSKREGELTYAFVKAKFTPAFTHEYDAKTGITATPNSKNDFSKLYVFNEGGNYLYMTNEDQAKEYKNDNNNLPYNTYTDCICFYMVYLDSGSKTYNVLRNDYFKVQINSVSRLGDPVQGPNDPAAEKDGKASINVTIDVQPWALKIQPAVLGD